MIVLRNATYDGCTGLKYIHVCMSIMIIQYLVCTCIAMYSDLPKSGVVSMMVNQCVLLSYVSLSCDHLHSTHHSYNPWCFYLTCNILVRMFIYRFVSCHLGITQNIVLQIIFTRENFHKLAYSKLSRGNSTNRQEHSVINVIASKHLAKG